MLQANKRFAELLKIPTEMMHGGADRSLLNHLCSQVADQEAFLERVMYLYAHPDEKARDELLLKDGTVLDRYSSLTLGPDGKHYVRIWTFRDIIDRKRTARYS